MKLITFSCGSCGYCIPHGLNSCRSSTAPGPQEDRKVRDKQARLQEDMRKLREVEEYNPFGRGGAGAPLRGQDGKASGRPTACFSLPHS